MIKVNGIEITKEGIRFEEGTPEGKIRAFAEKREGRWVLRDWVIKLLEILEDEDWKWLMDLCVRRNILSEPNYIGMAYKKLDEWKAHRTILRRLISAIRGGKLAGTSPKDKSVKLDKNIIAGIIALGEIPKFEKIGVRKGGIINPKLPIRKSGDMAELIGIWTGDGSLSSVGYFAFINKDKKFVDYVLNLVRRIFGEVGYLILKVKNEYQIRFRSVLVIEALLRFGAEMGKKSRIFTKWKVPDWIAWNREYALRYLKGLLECDGSVKINPKKRDYSLRYSRAIEAELDKEELEKLIHTGSKVEMTGALSAPAWFILSRKRDPPYILLDEAWMIEKYTGMRAHIRADKVFYFPHNKRMTILWEVYAYGREELINFLREVRPYRLIDKLPKIEDRMKS